MRQDLPSGTITLLFTDVEGSTKLLHEVGDERYSGILAEHHRLCRQAWQAHRGVEVQTDGDAFFVVFEDAADALMGAQAAQQLLADEPLKVRMGMHTGRVLLKDTGYVGHSVHLAARIASSCHGAQVVLSRATMDQAGHGFVYVDLGEHRLKDIDDPVSIFQLGEGSHPPLKTISNTNLPRMASSFLGRQRELAEVVVLLEQPARLVTLTGPGGTGKSRLALEAAGSVVGSFKGGVFWVALSALREPSLVVATISQTLGVQDDLAQHINEREMLLLLDNLEHVIECAPELSALLLACPHLSMLVTSRELLRVQGEVEYPVPPLTQHEAVALFCERARLEPSDEVGVLCSRLDCLPLAVELAAARTRALSPAQILERLGQRLDLLKGGRDSNPRQQTLRATIEWSHELLSDEEQTLFRRLSVFAGGCTLEAAQTVGGAELDTLQSLVEKSLVRFSAGRFSMLETIRQYATEQLYRADETEQLRSLHAARHAQLAITLADPVRFHSSDSLAELGDEHDNMRVALGFAFERDDVPMASKLLSGLWFYWLITGQGAEAAAWVRRYLASSRESTEPLDRYVGDDAAAEILRFTGQAELARQMKEDLVATGLSHPSAAINGAPIFGATAGALSDLAWMDLTEGRMSQARAHADEALKMRRELGIPGGIGHALTAVAGIAFHEGDYRGALKVFTEATTAFEDIEIDPDSLDSRVMMAQCELLLERADEARALLRDAFPAVIQLADGMLDVLALRVIAMLAAASGQPETSAVLFGGADRMLHDSSVHQFSKHEDMVHESYRGRARAALGDQAFGTAHQRGRETPRDEIMRLAIGSLG